MPHWAASSPKPCRSHRVTSKSSVGTRRASSASRFPVMPRRSPWRWRRSRAHDKGCALKKCACAIAGIHMTARIIDGKAIAAELRAAVAAEVRRLTREHGVEPGLAVLLVGENPASAVYVRSKAKQTLEAGMHS